MGTLSISRWTLWCWAARAWGGRNHISDTPNKGQPHCTEGRCPNSGPVQLPIPVVSLDRTSRQSGHSSWSLWLTENPRQYHPFHYSRGRPLHMEVRPDDVLRSQEKHEEEGQIWGCVADKLDKGFLDEQPKVAPGWDQISNRQHGKQEPNGHARQKLDYPVFPPPSREAIVPQSGKQLLAVGLGHKLGKEENESGIWDVQVEVYIHNSSPSLEPAARPIPRGGLISRLPCMGLTSETALHVKLGDWIFLRVDYLFHTLNRINHSGLCFGVAPYSPSHCVREMLPRTWLCVRIIQGTWKKIPIPKSHHSPLNEPPRGVERGQLFYKVLLGMYMPLSRESWGCFISNGFTFTHSPSLHEVINKCVLWANTNWQQISSCLWLWFGMEMSSLFDVFFFPFWFWAPLGWLAKNQVATLPFI